MTIELHATEFTHARAAIAHAQATGGVAIQVASKILATTRAEADRLAATGAEFAYLFNHRLPDGALCVVTVPVNY
jgi:hypothetical protein